MVSKSAPLDRGVILKGMSKVWIVTVGAYSDYRIDSVWDDEAAAEGRAAFLKSLGGYSHDDARTEEYEVGGLVSGTAVWEVQVRVDGSVCFAGGEEMDDDDKVEGDQIYWDKYTGAAVYSTSVVGGDKERAIKVAKERWRGTEVQEKLLRCARAHATFK